MTALDLARAAMRREISEAEYETEKRIHRISPLEALQATNQAGRELLEEITERFRRKCSLQ